MSAQNEQKKFKIAGVGFYNLENLFDTVNDTLINDEEFLPDGARTWTPERYQENSPTWLLLLARLVYQI